MAVESMTVHPNSPTSNHEHNSLLTDERSSNSPVIFKWNYWFVLCFYTKARGFFCLFLSEGLNSPFLENEYRGKERHVDPTEPTGSPKYHPERYYYYHHYSLLIFITFSQSRNRRLKPARRGRSTRKVKLLTASLVKSNIINVFKSCEKQVN